MAQFILRIDSYRTVWPTYDIIQSYCNYIEKQNKNRTSKGDLQRCFFIKVFFWFLRKIELFYSYCIENVFQKYWEQLFCRTPLGSNFWASDNSYSFLEIWSIEPRRCKSALSKKSLIAFFQWFLSYKLPVFTFSQN